jgi:hypothetical protein
MDSRLVSLLARLFVKPADNDSHARLVEDFEWARRASEVQENPDHFGNLVAVHNQRVLAFGRDRQKLVSEASTNAQAPAEQIVVVLVPRPGLWGTPK